MNKLTISAFLVLGTLTLFVKAWTARTDLNINLSEEDSYLYL